MRVMEGKVNINIYYGGRGLMDDPTLYVINKILCNKVIEYKIRRVYRWLEENIHWREPEI